LVVVGADASPHGWACVALLDGAFFEAQEVPDVGTMLLRWPEAEAFGIDIPIGLPLAGPRRADLAARRFVTKRWASVWLTPRRELLETEWAPGLGISKQAHGMRHRIKQVEAAGDHRLCEVHPEVTFAHLGGSVTICPKRTWQGLQQRLDLLRDNGISLPSLPMLVAPDDLVDAAAVAWTAVRIARGVAVTLPDDPEPGEPVIRY
jgi:predicted RNase H-like nuclease